MGQYLESVEVSDSGMVSTTWPPQRGVGNGDLTGIALCLSHKDRPVVVYLDPNRVLFRLTYNIPFNIPFIKTSSVFFQFVKESCTVSEESFKPSTLME